MGMAIRTGILIALLGASAASPLVHAQDAVRIANEGGIRDAWMLADGVSLAAPGYPAAFAARGDNVCLAMGYRIRPDGRTGEFVMLRGWNSSSGAKEPEAGFWDAFSQASAAALAQWKFKPRAEVSMVRPVDTVATMTFMGSKAEDATGLRGRCAVPDLVALLEDAKHKLAERGDLNRSLLDKQYRQQTRFEMIRTPRPPPQRQ